MIRSQLFLQILKFLIFGVLAITIPETALTQEKPLIGAQISILEGDNWDTCEKYFQGLKKLGYNTIILRVFHNRKDRFHNLVKESVRKHFQEGVYFNTDQSPTITDILTPACKIAHRNGLKIFAWMTTLKANYARKLRPQVLSYDKKRGNFIREKNLMDPQAPENIAFLKQLFKDLAAYPIDGILLQDDLILRHNQGFKKINHTVVPIPADIYRSAREIKPYRAPFYNWRQQQALNLQHLANEIFTICRTLKPKILCAQNIHYELLYNADWGRDWFASTLASIAASEADYLMVMAYQERIRRELELTSERELTSTMTKLFKNGQVHEKERIIFKFEIPPLTGSLKQKQKSIVTLQEIINNARKKGWQDLILTPCNNLTTAQYLKSRGQPSVFSLQ